MPRSSRSATGATDPPRTRRPSSKKPNGAANGVSGEEVARRAYEIYESRGRNHGMDLDHWLEAERELKAGPTDVKPRKARKAPAAGA